MRRLFPGFARVAIPLVQASGLTVAAQQGTLLVTADDLASGLGADPTRWLHYSGDYTSQRHSPLSQITPQNVRGLTPQWVFQTETLGKFEATPIVLDGVIYITGPLDVGWAIDARTGREIWRYRRVVPPDVIICCGLVNRGFAAWGDRLFKVTLDAHVVALSRKTGAIVWDTIMAPYRNGYGATAAPLVVKDKVIVGMTGGEYGVRGFIDAYDANTGKLVWRFHTTAGPDDPGHYTWKGTDEKAWEHGGGATWLSGSYDPETNLIFWGTGNAGPDYSGAERGGDNFYTASLVALDATTGKLRWHYQFTPHDVWDYDATQMPVLADLRIAGRLRKVVMVANRNGFFYTLDRATGKVIVAKPFVKTTWAKEVDVNGRPVQLPGQIPSEQGTHICPDALGGTNFMSPAFNPTLGLFFVTAREVCGTFYSWKEDYKPGDGFRGGTFQRDEGERQVGALRAIDPTTGERKWDFPYVQSSMAGVLSTASGLVFAGSAANFMAFDARTGKNLWRFQTGAPLNAGPTTYMVDGRQYVLLPSGTTLTAFALPDASAP